jgi:hypothetical protein
MLLTALIVTDVVIFAKKLFEFGFGVFHRFRSALYLCRIKIKQRLLPALHGRRAHHNRVGRVGASRGNLLVLASGMQPEWGIRGA